MPECRLTGMDAINLLVHYQQSVIKSLQQNLPLVLGEVVSARVHARRSDNVYDLQIRGNQVRAESTRPLQPGNILQLKVDQVKNPVILRVIESGTELPRKNEQSLLDQTRNTLLREAMPRQQPLLPLFKQLFAIAGKPVSDKSPLPESVRKAISEIQHLFRKPTDLTSAKHIRQAFERSGLYLESRLAGQLQGQQTAPPVQDMKALLLKLLQQLSSQEIAPPRDHTAPETLVHRVDTQKPVTGGTKANIPDKMLVKSPGGSDVMPRIPDHKPVPVQADDARNRHTRTNMDSRLPVLNELRQQVDAGLSRIHIHQNNAVVSDSHPQPLWAVEIPVHDGKNIHTIALTIHEDSVNRDQSTGRGWTATLQLDLGNLGTVQVRLGLRGEEISASIWAEQAATVELFETNLEHLAKRFSKAGLRVDQLRCLNGNAPDTKIFQPLSLVDIQL